MGSGRYMVCCWRRIFILLKGFELKVGVLSFGNWGEEEGKCWVDYCGWVGDCVLFS